MGRTDASASLSVDIGGTFTDVVVRRGDRQASAKVLTTAAAPDIGVMDGIDAALEVAGIGPSEVGLIVHGTTLATNALIERKGARTAMLTTAGFRDVLEIAYEHRFEQYDIHIDKPRPLVPRALRFEVAERLDAAGGTRVPLDEAAVARIGAEMAAEGVESVAVCFLHSYRRPDHEQRAAAILAAALPGVRLSLSSEVCPEIREYNRFSTTSANAYVQPLMARYLSALRGRLADAGFDCPVLLMTSGGGLTTLETAIRFPIRLVESGPAGGAVLAATIARRRGLDRVLSFDMGGTTAKICLIDAGEPQASRDFEVAREYRFAKGSGLPLRIPVIEMVEIGAGGGSIAGIDGLGRLRIGPESAGSVPGPACYGRGGGEPTVTDADLVLGRIDPGRFAASRIRLDPALAEAALADRVAGGLGLDVPRAAAGVSEIVEENMAAAARVHAVERGKDLAERSLIAFGGAAPLHAAALAGKLGIRHVVIPSGAGVGSAVGFLLAPIAFEVVRSLPFRLSDPDRGGLEALLQDMHDEAVGVVLEAARGAALHVVRAADMRYVGQGHEITVPLPDGAVDDAFFAEVRRRFDALYARLYGRSIPDLEIEVLSWTLRIAEQRPPPPRCPPPAPNGPLAAAPGARTVFDAAAEAPQDAVVVERASLAAGIAVRGPALITEDETTTYVTRGFTATLNEAGDIEMFATDATEGEAVP